MKTECTKEYWMNMAAFIAAESDDPSTQVGAVLVYEPNGRIQAKARNTLPPGVANHAYRRERPLKYKWTGHAEERLIAQCARLGIICDEAIVVVTHHPCSTCARILIEAGISKIIYRDAVFGGDWADDIAISREMLAEAGVEIKRYDTDFGIDEG